MLKTIRHALLACILIGVLGWVAGCFADSKPSNVENHTDGEPSNVKSYIESANQKLKQQDWIGAIQDANEAMRIDSSLGHPYYIRGVARNALGERQQSIEDVRTALDIYRRKNRADGIALAQKTLEKMENNSLFPTPTPSLQRCQYSQFVSSVENRVNSGNLDLFALYGEVQRGKPVLEQLRQLPECLQAKEILKSSLWKAESDIANTEQTRDAIYCGTSSDVHSCQDRVLANYRAKLERINNYYNGM
jgi:tetratricopeptide (TPR) repeat protein